MNDQSFSTRLVVDSTEAEVYAAINDPRSWWSTTIEGSAEHVGDEFVVDSPGHHCWRFRVVELVPPSTIAWRVLDSSSTDFVRDSTEWNGTTVHFDICTMGDRTEILFTHSGLVPEFECFEACSAGWTGYIQHSLPTLLATGRGEPGAY